MKLTYHPHILKTQKYLLGYQFPSGTCPQGYLSDPSIRILHAISHRVRYHGGGSTNPCVCCGVQLAPGTHSQCRAYYIDRRTSKTSYLSKSRRPSNIINIPFSIEPQVSLSIVSLALISHLDVLSLELRLGHFVYKL